jgi:protein-S-isoprenylcysteine O-methyltransferase Ste14
MLYWVLWAIFTAILLAFTLAKKGPYKFSRFLAFESILSLIFLNSQSWFVDPLSLRKVLSWFSLSGSIFLVVVGLVAIKTKGKPSGDFEDTTRLITTGAYRFIRHPLYASLLLFAVGGFLQDPSWTGAILVGSTFVGVLLTTLIEESHNLERFGEEYREYMEKTWRFIPLVY